MVTPDNHISVSCDRADIDECSDPEFLGGCNQKCNNIPGSFQCHCESGYFHTNRITCEGKAPFVPAVFIVLFMCRWMYRALEQLSKHVSGGGMNKHVITKNTVSSCCPPWPDHSYKSTCASFSYKSTLKIHFFFICQTLWTFDSVFISFV